MSWANADARQLWCPHTIRFLHMAGSEQGRAGRLQSWALGHREKTSLDLAFDKVGQCIVTLRCFSWARREVRKTGMVRNGSSALDGRWVGR